MQLLFQAIFARICEIYGSTDLSFVDFFICLFFLAKNPKYLEVCKKNITAFNQTLNQKIEIV